MKPNQNLQPATDAQVKLFETCSVEELTQRRELFFFIPCIKSFAD